MGHGSVAQGDLLKLKGPLPGLLSASAKARIAYQEMTQAAAFQHPVPYASIDPSQYQAILLPGAICHGILVLARTIDPQTGRSVLMGARSPPCPAHSTAPVTCSTPG